MNKFIKSLTAAFVGTVVITTSALAFPNPDGARPDHENWQPPQPVEIVAPNLLSSHDGVTVHVRLTIDEEGRASDVEVLRRRDPILKREIVKAVEQWRFEPATSNGKPTKMRVILPIELKVDYNS
jgi:TonB family protein